MTRPIAVGVDAANLLHDRRGMGRYVRMLLHEWRSAFADRIQTTLLVPNALPFITAAALRGTLHGRWRIARRRAARNAGLDVVWYPWNGMTWHTDVPSVVTIHDVWPFAAPARDPVRRRREQGHYVEAVAHARRFIAVSSFTKHEAVRLIGVEEKRVDVVHHGVQLLTSEANPLPARIEGAERYVLFVGEAEPRKDVATLLQAMARLPEPLRATTALVVAGRKGPVSTKAAADARVLSIGSVPDERLAALYAGAAVFVLPSRYEGFGFPLLEAMQYGTPVIASDAAALREAGGDAALYFAVGDADALANKLALLLDDGALAARLAVAGRARAAQFTPERCARATLEVFEHVARR